MRGGVGFAVAGWLICFWLVDLFLRGQADPVGPLVVYQIDNKQKGVDCVEFSAWFYVA